MSENIKRLSDAELEIMQAIWRSGSPLTSNEILDRVKHRRKWALSTLMTVLARLAEKGFVLCDRSTRTNYYSAAISENEYKAMEGKTLLEKLCGNSIQNFVTSLYQENAIDDKDLSELRKYLDGLKVEE